MILGAEIPRIFTPPRRELSQQTSDGWAAIAFAELLLDIRLFPWQKWLLIHALELNPDFTYRFRTVFVNEARQNGKTLVMIVLALWHIYAKGSRTVIATAQDLSKSEDAWASAVESFRRREATTRSPASSNLATMRPVKLRRVASGLMMESVRSVAMKPSLKSAALCPSAR